MLMRWYCVAIAQPNGSKFRLAIVWVTTVVSIDSSSSVSLVRVVNGDMGLVRGELLVVGA